MAKLPTDMIITRPTRISQSFIASCPILDLPLVSVTRAMACFLPLKVSLAADTRMRLLRDSGLRKRKPTALVLVAGALRSSARSPITVEVGGSMILAVAGGDLLNSRSLAKGHTWFC